MSKLPSPILLTNTLSASADGGRLVQDVKMGYGDGAAADWAGAWQRCVCCTCTRNWVNCWVVRRLSYASAQVQQGEGLYIVGRPEGYAGTAVRGEGSAVRSQQTVAASGKQAFVNRWQKPSRVVHGGHRTSGARVHACSLLCFAALDLLLSRCGFT